MTIENKILSRFSNRIKRGTALAAYTSFKIGGPAEYLLEATSHDDIVEAKRLAIDINIPFYFLAGCSNVLISDDGLPGLVVINKTSSIEWRNDYSVQVDSGYNLNQLVLEISERGWGDLSFAAGIPGSIGAALAGGAGAYGHLVCKFLIDAHVLEDDGVVSKINCDELGIQYRTSSLKKRNGIMLYATLGNFKSGDAEALMATCNKLLEERETKHPSIDLPCAGSFFKNLAPSKPGERRTPAGKLLEEAGVKPLRYGGAGVFEKHANIIVNYGGATAADVNNLADEMTRRVKDKFGITLEREVQYLS